MARSGRTPGRACRRQLSLGSSLAHGGDLGVDLAQGQAVGTGFPCALLHRFDCPQCLGLSQRRQCLVEGFRRRRGQQCDGLAVRRDHQMSFLVERLPHCCRSTPEFANADKVHHFIQGIVVCTIVYSNDAQRQRRSSPRALSGIHSWPGEAGRLEPDRRRRSDTIRSRTSARGSNAGPVHQFPETSR